ncbi:MAG: amidohydrolase family protein [Rhodobacteraceae bacterium]|nr:amidohydrolase family protein [Paracoccaceae bacterium]
MSDDPIINCHIHLFTERNIPTWMPNFFGAILRHIGIRFGVLRFIVSFSFVRYILQNLGVQDPRGWVTRLYAMRDIGRKSGPEAILNELQKYYPSDTKFVVLPMDMRYAKYGQVKEDIYEQHRKLSELYKLQKYKDIIIPFATFHPDRPDGVAEFRNCIENYGFKGLKLYPKLGYRPDDPILMNEIYPICIKHNIPVMSHCSSGGVKLKGWDQQQCDAVSRPQAFLKVLDEFNDLRVCLAHFGGAQAWDTYINDGIDPNDPESRKDNFLAALLDILETDDYPNLFTDISYTAFKISQNLPFLKVFLENDLVRSKTLFGSDYYMSRQEESSERAVSVNLRVILGETVFNEISKANPARFLTGKLAKPTPPPNLLIS